MPRPTINPLPQTELVSEYKRWVDTARFSSRGSAGEVGAINRVLDLLRQNPESSLRKHVTHNIGCTRRKWLRQLSTTLPTPLALERDLLWRMGCGT